MFVWRCGVFGCDSESAGRFCVCIIFVLLILLGIFIRFQNGGGINILFHILLYSNVGDGRMQCFILVISSSSSLAKMVVMAAWQCRRIIIIWRKRNAPQMLFTKIGATADWAGTQIIQWRGLLRIWRWQIDECWHHWSFQLLYCPRKYMETMGEMRENVIIHAQCSEGFSSRYITTYWFLTFMKNFGS